MYKNGYLKVEVVSPKIEVGNVSFNKNEILRILDKSKSSLLMFPELAITGYSASDLFFFKEIIDEAVNAVLEIVNKTKFKGLYIIGTPFLMAGVLYNVGFVCLNKKILGIVPKKYLPNTKEFYEKRQFTPWLEEKGYLEVDVKGSSVPFGNLIFVDNEKELRVGVEICQDMWGIYTPGDDLALASANVICNLSASTETVGKHDLRKSTVINNSRKQVGAYIYTSSSFHESASDTIYSGAMLISCLGKLLAEKEPFSEAESLTADIDIDAINYQRRLDSTYRDQFLKNRHNYLQISMSLLESKDYQFNPKLDKTPFVKKDKSYYDQAILILTHALEKKLLSLPSSLRKVMIGVSGGLDSCLALLIAHHVFSKMGLPLKDIFAVIMPSDVTSSDSLDRAEKLVDGLNVRKMIIPITDEVDIHLQGLNHELKDVTFENAQARIRTLNLMNLANKHQGFVLGTGDLSEIALGFMTYNGDQMSMYAINSSLPKTLVRELVKYCASKEYKGIKDVLLRIVFAKVTPELVEDQDTEQIIGRYEVNDFIIYHHLVRGATKEKIAFLIKKAFNLTIDDANTYVTRFFDLFYKNQFKRQTMPEGPKVLSFSLSPRGDYRLPSDIKIK